MKKFIALILVVLGVLVVIGCQTTKPVTPVNPTPVVVSGQNSVEFQGTGFSPAIGPLTLQLTFSNSTLVKDWKIEIGNAQGVVKTFTDVSPVATLTWDGKNDSNVVVPDGNYTATLSVNYKNDLKSTTFQSQQFAVVSTPPVVAIIADSLLLTLDGKGGIKPIKFTIAANSAIANPASWTFSVLDANKKEVASASGNYPSNVYTWDGKVQYQNSIDPSQQYTAVANVKDEFGNSSQDSIKLTPSDSKKIVMITIATDQFFSKDKAIKFGLSFGKLAIEVKSWKIEIKNESGAVVRTINSSGLFLVKSASWDGKTDAGFIAGNGKYTATLTVDYGLVFGQATAVSGPFTFTK
jgi:flagellar hook assembly protein FlgD